MGAMRNFSPRRAPRALVPALAAALAAEVVVNAGEPPPVTPRSPTRTAAPAGEAATAGPLAAHVSLTAEEVRPPDQADDARFAALPAARERLRAAASKARIAFPLEKVALRVEKAARRITLSSGGKVLRTFQVGLGPAPTGQKAKEGDGRTPEGSLYICTRNPRSRYHLFLGLSYPRPEDAARALSEGRIDAATAGRVSGVTAPACPPWDTPLGGAVGLHGRGAKKDWTLGCVALEDGDMDELWLACPLGTPVQVDP